MEKSKGEGYFISKLFEINYKMSIHVGSSTARLSNYIPKILSQLNNISVVPNKHKKDFNNLLDICKSTIHGTEGRIPCKIKMVKNNRTVHLRNAAASKYIKLLLDIYDEMTNSK